MFFAIAPVIVTKKLTAVSSCDTLVQGALPCLRKSAGMEAPFRMDPEALPHDCGVVVSPRNFRDEDGSAGIWDAAEPAVTDMCWGHKPLHGAWVPSVSEGLR